MQCCVLGHCSEEGGPVTEGEQKKEEGEVKAEEGEQAPAEEEDKEMTYEEYMALKSKVRETRHVCGVLN